MSPTGPLLQPCPFPSFLLHTAVRERLSGAKWDNGSSWLLSREEGEHMVPAPHCNISPKQHPSFAGLKPALEFCLRPQDLSEKVRNCSLLSSSSNACDNIDLLFFYPFSYCLCFKLKNLKLFSFALYRSCSTPVIPNLFSTPATF